MAIFSKTTPIFIFGVTLICSINGKNGACICNPMTDLRRDFFKNGISKAHSHRIKIDTRYLLCTCLYRDYLENLFVCTFPSPWTSSYWTAMSSFLFLSSDQSGGCYLGPKLHPRGGFFGPWFFIILKNSHQDLSNEGSNFILSSIDWVSFCSIIRVKSMASGWSGQNADACPSIKKSMD